MYIGVDLDSVLADIAKPLFSYHNRVYKTNHRINQHRVYDLSVLWDCSKEEALSRIHDFYASPDFLTTKSIPGAEQGIKYLSINHQLRVITSRPNSISTLTKNWIDQYFPNRFRAIHETNWVAKNQDEPRQKKSVVCHQLGIDVIIEDALEFALDCASNNIRVILMNMPWNQTKTLPKNVTRIYNWKEIKEYL